jgi:hypothetical protein
MRRVLVPFSVAPSSSVALQSAAACCCAAVQISELSGLHYFLLQSTTKFRVRLLSFQPAFLPLHHHGISTALITQKEGEGKGPVATCSVLRQRSTAIVLELTILPIMPSTLSA